MTERANVISIRLTGTEAEEFADATGAFPGLSHNHAGRLAAHLFVLMAQEQPDWIPEAVARLRRGQAERRRRRGR